MAIEDIQVIPLTPEEVREGAKENHYIPPEVVDVVNDLLVESYDRFNTTIKVSQADILQRLVDIEFIESSEKQTAIDNGWLEFELLFDDYGWVVIFQEVYGEFKNMYTFRAK